MRHRFPITLFAAASVVAVACTSVFGDAFHGYSYVECKNGKCPDASAPSRLGDGTSSHPAESPDLHSRKDASADSPSGPPGMSDARTTIEPDSPSPAPTHSRPPTSLGTVPNDGAAADGRAGKDEGQPSCRDVARTCGPTADDDCCASDVIPGGTFQMGIDTSPVPEDPVHAPTTDDRPRHPVTVSTFVLDRYEVTLGRFRNFVAVYQTLAAPSGDAGAIPGRPGSGWNSDWNYHLPTYAGLKMQLGCNTQGLPTWTESRDVHETYAMNCLNWFVAFAFCLWDGGRLPTEAEWEYASAGGSQQRVFPWGDTFDDTRGNWNENTMRITPVGGAGFGRGVARWGQYDLSGNVWEWTRDTLLTYAASSTPLVDPVSPYNGTPAGYADPVMRGGSYWGGAEANVTSFHRVTWMADDVNVSIGVRCAREAKRSGDD